MSRGTISSRISWGSFPRAPVAGRSIGVQITESKLNAGHNVPDHHLIHKSSWRVAQTGIEDAALSIGADPTDGIVVVGAGTDVTSPALVHVRPGHIDAQQHVHS